MRLLLAALISILLLSSLAWGDDLVGKGLFCEAVKAQDKGWTPYKNKNRFF